MKTKQCILVGAIALALVGGLAFAAKPPLDARGSTWDFLEAKAKTVFRLKGGGKAKVKSVFQQQVVFDEQDGWSLMEGGQVFATGTRESLKPNGRRHLCTLDAQSAASLAEEFEAAFEQALADEGFTGTADMFVEDYFLKLKIKPRFKKELARSQLREKLLMLGTVAVDGFGVFSSRLTQKVRGVSEDVPLDDVL